MNGELPQLDQISVASPCHESWGNMQGDERARFCGQCRKHVYNFAEMTRPEIEALVVAKEGKFCATIFSPAGRHAAHARLSRRNSGPAAAAVAGRGRNRCDGGGRDDGPVVGTRGPRQRRG